MRNVLIPTKLDSIVKEILEKNNFVVVQDGTTKLPALAKAHPQTTAMIVRSEPVTAEIMDVLPHLRVIIRAGAGYDTIDTKYARRKGIDVMNTPGANANAVAEEVIAMILCAYRHLIAGDVTTRQGLWEKKNFMGRELTHKTVGIVGLGNIGQLVVRRVQGFECKILGYDPVISASKAEDLGVQLVSMEEIFSQADIITLHIPESPETMGIINKNYFTRMKSGAMLINCARAGILDENDLRAAKAGKKIVFCNDVYAEDAPGPKSVVDIADIMVPHLGANTEEANSNAARRAAEQLIGYVDRGIATYVVNRAAPEGLDEEQYLLAYYLARVARCYLGCETQPDRVEISLYGGLRQFANWLVAPIMAGISSDFDPLRDFQDANDYIKQKGITFVNREVDESKQYGKSMTVDLFEGSGNTRTKVSVRGTIAEGYPMVTRIDGFSKLYFDPIGHSVLVVYADKPGMLASITSVIAKHGININDIRCPFDPASGKSIAVLKVNQPANQPILDEILQKSGADKAVRISIEQTSR